MTIKSIRFKTPTATIYLWVQGTYRYLRRVLKSLQVLKVLQVVRAATGWAFYRQRVTPWQHKARFLKL